MKDFVSSSTGLGLGVVRAVARRPDLWAEAWRQWRALCPRRWWAGWPPLPVPARAYLSFRTEAMFGSPPAELSQAELSQAELSPAELSPAEVVGYLEWCRRMRALVR